MAWAAVAACLGHAAVAATKCCKSNVMQGIQDGVQRAHVHGCSCLRTGTNVFPSFSEMYFENKTQQCEF